MASNATSLALHVLDDAISDLLVTKYTYVAAMTVMVYDLLQTYDQEVARVWYTRWSMGKALFLLNRYVPPILFSFDLYYQLHPQSSPNFCKHSFAPPNILGIISLGLVEFILVLRTYALYQSKTLLAILSMLCVVATVTMIITTMYMFEHLIVFIPDPVPAMVGCIPQCTAPLCRMLLIAFWIPFFVSETTIFVLTAWKSYRSSLGLRSHTKFVTIVYRDGFIYYIVIISISLGNLLIWCLAPISLAYLATSLMRSLQVTVGSRLLLNIRGILERDYTTSTEISSLGFRHDKRNGGEIELRRL